MTSTARPTTPAAPDAVWVTEVWRSREAHHAVLTTDAVTAALDRGRALIERVGKQDETSYFHSLVL